MSASLLAIVFGLALHIGDLRADQLPPRQSLDAIWDDYMLKGNSDAVAVTIRDGQIGKTVLPAKQSCEFAQGRPESAGLLSPGSSVMQLGEGFWGNGGWVLKGGLLGIAKDDLSTLELHGKAIVHRHPYFPFPFHRTIPHDTSYDFFLLHRQDSASKATVITKWTFPPEEVVLKPQNVGPSEEDVRATLRYDATAKRATVIIEGLTHSFEQHIDVSFYMVSSQPDR